MLCRVLLLLTFGTVTSVATTAESRDRLTVQDLFNQAYPQIVENRYFKPVGTEQAPAHRLSGTLHFSETLMTTHHPDTDWKGSGQTYFPTFSLDVITHQRHLVPLERGIILSGEKHQSFWNIIFSPGQVWSEAGDNGYSRAALPFTLTDNRVGQARNGIATFVFNSMEISPVAIQITQETAAEVDYMRTDFRASILAEYEPSDFPESERRIRDLQAELDARLRANSA
ncbi:unnamed protein product, partial [marine sediment metagenome]